LKCTSIKSTVALNCIMKLRFTFFGLN